MTSPAEHIAVVGAGAAGLATAIFTRELNPARTVILLDGAARPGAKILVSGGSRCNVTNTEVTEDDYWGGKRTIIRRVLRALPVPSTIAFFERIGVPLKEEGGGKLFPRSDRSRDVLDALLRAADDAGVTVSASTRVHAVTAGRGFTLQTSRGPTEAGAVVLATGGLSLPKTGSDGGGFGIAQSLGHSLVPPTPALAPLMLSNGFHASLSGVAHEAEFDSVVRRAGSGAAARFASVDALRHQRSRRTRCLAPRPARAPARKADRTLGQFRPG